MSDIDKAAGQKCPSKTALPAWVSSGILGAICGAGVVFLGMKEQRPAGPPPVPDGVREQMMAAGASGMMGGGMMGGGMMGGGGPAGGGARDKRNLTSFVTKLELLTKGLRVDLDATQSAKIAARLAELEQAEKMTAEEAKSHLDALEEILTDEQKSALGAIDLPRGGRGGAGGGMGGPPGGMGGPGGASPDDNNPFQEETNQQKLHELLHALQPASVDAPSAPAESSAPSEPTNSAESDRPPEQDQ